MVDFSLFKVTSMLKIFTDNNLDRYDDKVKLFYRIIHAKTEAS